MSGPSTDSPLASGCRSARAARPPVAVHAPANMEDFVAESEWDGMRRVITLAGERGLPLAASGGFATSFYTAIWRNTKDLDLCVLAQDRDAIVAVTSDAGFHDLYDEKPYDRGWIYRATGRGVIVDIIWQLANRKGEVDAAWLTLGPVVSIHGDTLRLVPPEELIWSKIHVVQRERCDFPDIVNILYCCGSQLDWKALLERLRGEERLLASVMSLFSWLAPGRARSIPRWVWNELAIPPPSEAVERDDDRIRSIDSRPWFSPL